MEPQLRPLPYAKDALEPYVTGLTVEVRYERHQRGQLERLLDLVEGHPEQDVRLESLLVLDLWERAYYLDYFDGRKHYVENAIAHLLDWDFAAENLAQVLESAPLGEAHTPLADLDADRHGPQPAPELGMPGRAIAARPAL